MVLADVMAFVGLAFAGVGGALLGERLGGLLNTALGRAGGDDR